MIREASESLALLLPLPQYLGLSYSLLLQAVMSQQWPLHAMSTLLMRMTGKAFNKGLGPLSPA